MIDRLGLYQGALRILKQRKLASLTENVESRRLLDDAWDAEEVGGCLEAGQWLFATRSIAIDNAPSITPSFGYRYGFNKPTDWVRTMALCSDEFFNVPLNEMVDEAGYWYSNLTRMYVKYVSNDNAYGFNFALWPQTFQQFVMAALAQTVGPRLVQGSVDMEEVNKTYERALRDAMAKDAMNGPTAFPPTGQWAASRYGGLSGRRGSRWNGSPY